MEQVFIFKLARPAKKSGGDRYEYEWGPGSDKPFVIYIPQFISRKDGKPCNEVEVVFKPI